MSAALSTWPTGPMTAPPPLFIREDQAARLLRALSAGRSRGLFRSESEFEPAPAPRLAVSATTPPLTKRPPLIVVAGDSAFFAASLAHEWNRLGRRTQLVDLDQGFSSLDAFLGELAAERPECDLLVADARPGLGSATAEAIRRAAAVVLVSTPDPAAITETYALLKTLPQASQTGTVGLVLDRAPSEERAREAAERLGAVARRFLDRDVPYWGCVLEGAGDDRTALALREVAARTLAVLTGESA